MIGTPFRCYQIIKQKHSAWAIGNGHLGQIVTVFVRNYAKDKGSCCKDVAQTSGKTVQTWPKSDPPPTPWRSECPSDPQPVNYDPYKIKVPDIVVPPLPASNAKWNGVVISTGYHGRDQHGYQGGYHGGCQHDNPYEQPQPAKEEDTQEDQSFFGILKKLFGRGQSKEQKGDKEMMIDPRKYQPMLECAKTKGPCSVRPAPDPPPCPPPPPKPFPWIYVYAVTAFFSVMGVIYRIFLWKEEADRLSESAPIWRARRKVKRPYHDKDLPACVQYLIVGAGTAGWAAYRAIMQHDKTAKVFFITKEDVLPYLRPPLSKFMWWNQDPPDLKTLNYLDEGRRTTMYLSECRKFMDPVKFYRKKIGPAVSIATGWCVLRVDADDHVAYVRTMCGEQPIYYEKCLLAPGSKPKNLRMFKSAPKEVRDRVSTFRTIRDLETSFRKVREAKHVVIIGGGVLACELAWHLGKMNKVVERPPEKDPIEFVQIFKDKGVLSNVVPEYLGEWAAEKIKCEGVTLIPKTQVYDAFLTPDKRVELTLSNGTSLVTDYVLVCIGTEARVEMAEPSFLEQDDINGGFLVNTELMARTDLYVAGDAASIYSQWKDTRQRMEHYINAEEQGFIAGANMTGYWTPCNMEPHYWLRLGDSLEMEVVGEVGACMPIVALFKQCSDEQKAKPPASDGDRPCYKKTSEYQNRYKRGLLFYLRDETVVGFVFWNMPPIDDRKEVATELLRARPSYKDINLLAELLGFPETQCVYETPEELKEIGPCVNNWKVF